jgi:hypothetical protein
MSVPDWRNGRVCSQCGSRNIYFGVSGRGRARNRRIKN